MSFLYDMFTNVKDSGRQKTPLPYTDWGVELLSYGSLWRCLRLPYSFRIVWINFFPLFIAAHNTTWHILSKAFFFVGGLFLHRNWRLNILSVLILLRRNSTCFIFQRWFLVFGMSLFMLIFNRTLNTWLIRLIILQFWLLNIAFFAKADNQWLDLCCWPLMTTLNNTRARTASEFATLQIFALQLESIRNETTCERPSDKKQVLLETLYPLSRKASWNCWLLWCVHTIFPLPSHKALP